MSKEISYSIIIPCLNEYPNLTRLLPQLVQSFENRTHEIIVCNATACKDTEGLCKKLGVDFVESKAQSRAIQMNKAAAIAKHEVLYFIHADTMIPQTAASDIESALNAGYDSGCYRFKFDKDVIPLMINSSFTRFRGQMFRGGDQTLWVKRELFFEIGPYDEEVFLMEEYPLIKKLKQKASFTVMPKAVVVSSRKYDGNAYVKVNLVNLLVFILFHLGYPTMKLRKLYSKMLQN
ncbi:TIGR04283 family arsenosugar biosynthesis glycosyltransferase [Luteibaculum oceani]|uniref:TIGR04283 family arsenosugar biosynthesis glycosyltransferase n=1 Tax=Luteibaculum oceani TaxID=1294296 RepID=UPI0014776AE5|nr:TIGR04283 family arsenosugar biosynthesis glycosyltransferase [Luteibaculum oceani]